MSLDLLEDVVPAARTVTLPLLELSRITLARSVDSDDGRVPAGARGTIVHVWRSGRSAEVEFTAPLHAIATVGLEDMLAA